MHGIKTQDFFQKQILPNAQCLFDKWNLSHPNALALFQIFCCIDTSHDGMISLEEFYRFFGIKKILITERLWHTCLIRDNGGGSGGGGVDCSNTTTALENEKKEECYITLSFHDFVSAICSICSHTVQSDASRWGQFAFEIFDIDKIHSLSLAEYDALIRMVHDGSSNKVKRECMAIIETDVNGSNKEVETKDEGGGHLKKEEAHTSQSIVVNVKTNDMTISQEQFLHLVQEQPQLVRPLLDIQHKIRRQTLGETFWDKTLIPKERDSKR